MSFCPEGFRAPKPDAQKEEVEDSRERSETWQRVRQKWRSDNRQDEDRSIFPNARKHPDIREAEPVLQKGADRLSGLSHFWRRQKANPQYFERYGGPHLDMMDPPMVGSRQAKVHVWTKSANLVPKRNEKQERSRGKSKWGKARQEITIDKEEFLVGSSSPESEGHTQLGIDERPEPPQPRHQHVGRTKFDLHSITKARKTRDQFIAEVKTRYPEWVHIAEKDPQWLEEAKRKQAERAELEQRDQDRLEEWCRRGPVPRCAIQD